MRADEWTNVLFFSFFFGLAWLRPLSGRQRAQATALGVCGIALVLSARSAWRWAPTAPASILRDWLPALLMLMVYWQSGQFLVTSSARFQAWLARFDQKIFSVFPRNDRDLLGKDWIQNYLELAYFFCYPLVPLGLGAIYAAHLRGFAGEYWAVILPSTYPCYVLLPFVQALPPRLLDSDPYPVSHSGPIRALNLWVLRHGSIQSNTFPSAHVASTMAASFVLLRFVPAVGAIFLIIAFSIAIGAVVGRYHYAADVIAAAVLAAVVFAIALVFRS